MIKDKHNILPTGFESHAGQIKAPLNGDHLMINPGQGSSGSSMRVHNGHRGQTEYLQSGGISKYKVVYITWFPQQDDIETKNGKENGHSYSYLEAIDTVNN